MTWIAAVHTHTHTHTRTRTRTPTPTRTRTRTHAHTHTCPYLAVALPLSVTLSALIPLHRFAHLKRFNNIAILNNKFQMASGQGSQWLIESATIFSSMRSPPFIKYLSILCLNIFTLLALTQLIGSLFNLFITLGEKSTFSCPTYTAP